MRRKTKLAALLCLVLILAAGTAAYTPELPAAQLEQKYTDAHSRFTEIDGLRVHYRDQGTGPALVLVHGSNAALQTWDGWTEVLSQDFRVIALDLPGHGLTGPDPKGRYDWISMAALVDDLTTQLGLSSFSIAGNSMGGAVAWNYAVMYPAKVEKLILLDSRGYPSEEPMPAIFKAYATPILGHLLTRITPRSAIAASLAKVYGDPETLDEDQVTLYHELTLRAGNREATRQRLSSPSNDRLLPRIGTITAPTLIMWGKADSWILPKYAANFLRDIENSSLRMYDGLGHAPMEEAPELTARDARAFLLQQ